MIFQLKIQKTPKRSSICDPQRGGVMQRGWAAVVAITSCYESLRTRESLLALAVRETVAGRWLGALEGRGLPPLFPMYP